mmetsp:Transcript_25184/g.54740  ORF Transcript_25184/g.54740 Transcript_25184/m.54740 type:complete len:246 (+) Transcript_25184:267-1004(+)
MKTTQTWLQSNGIASDGRALRCCLRALNDLMYCVADLWALCPHNQLHSHLVGRVNAEAHAHQNLLIPDKDASHEHSVGPCVGGHSFRSFAGLHPKGIDHSLHCLLQPVALAQPILVRFLALGVELLPAFPEVGDDDGLDVVSRGHLQVLQLVLVFIAILLSLACGRVDLFDLELQDVHQLAQSPAVLRAPQDSEGLADTVQGHDVQRNDRLLLKLLRISKVHDDSDLLQHLLRDGVCAVELDHNV